ncbi:hypothetical protein CY34DRAFT_411664 [Suillus luteus UH-Slu-Lm8-n1]|uniref:Uncharacterized protein n=1 Tax=Suillus luteus UH-Slu-Lm8-n1 TaxID=930992 RepID=A0A0D0AXI9_9AGAM|nr:hypothetical protein CY34DRAFT_411664 [Suillus luteus UH-Slu-Lm8-n1]
MKGPRRSYRNPSLRLVRLHTLTLILQKASSCLLCYRCLMLALELGQYKAAVDTIKSPNISHGDSCAPYTAHTTTDQHSALSWETASHPHMKLAAIEPSFFHCPCRNPGVYN